MRVFTMLMLALLLAAPGCKTIDLSSKLPWSKSGDEEPEFQQPTRMIVIWSDAIYNEIGKSPTRGFGGRIYFYNDHNQAIPVDGRLVVYAFDETHESKADATPDRRFAFTQDQFQRHYSPSDLGASYSIWIPWEPLGGEEKKISLLPVFTDGKTGKVIMGQQAPNILPGSDSEEKRRKTENVFLPPEGFLQRPSPPYPNRQVNYQQGQAAALAGRRTLPGGSAMPDAEAQTQPNAAGQLTPAQQALIAQYRADQLLATHAQTTQRPATSLNYGATSGANAHAMNTQAMNTQAANAQAMNTQAAGAYANQFQAAQLQAAQFQALQRQAALEQAGHYTSNWQGYAPAAGYAGQSVTAGRNPLNTATIQVPPSLAQKMTAAAAAAAEPGAGAGPTTTDWAEILRAVQQQPEGNRPATVQPAVPEPRRQTWIDTRFSTTTPTITASAQARQGREARLTRYERSRLQALEQQPELPGRGHAPSQPYPAGPPFGLPSQP